MIAAESIELLRILKQNLLDFIQDLMVVLPEESDFIWFHMFVQHQVPMLDVMTYITKNIVPLEKRVATRDEEYFKTHAVMFEKLNNFESNVNRFKMLWDANQNKEDREMVWRWLECFIDLGKRYKKLTT